MSRFCRFFCVTGMAQICPPENKAPRVPQGRGGTALPHHHSIDIASGPPATATGGALASWDSTVFERSIWPVRSKRLPPVGPTRPRNRRETRLPNRSDRAGSKSFVSESGIAFKAQETAQTAGELDTIVVPGGSGLQNPDILREASAWLASPGPSRPADRGRLRRNLSAGS